MASAVAQLAGVSFSTARSHLQAVTTTSGRCPVSIVLSLSPASAMAHRFPLRCTMAGPLHARSHTRAVMIRHQGVTAHDSHRHCAVGLLKRHTSSMSRRNSWLTSRGEVCIGAPEGGVVSHYRAAVLRPCQTFTPLSMQGLAEMLAWATDSASATSPSGSSELTVANQCSALVQTPGVISSAPLAHTIPEFGHC